MSKKPSLLELLSTSAAKIRRRQCFASAGRFCNFSSDEKVMIERLEENTSEQLRLKFAVEYNYKHINIHSKFLLILSTDPMETDKQKTVSRVNPADCFIIDKANYSAFGFLTHFLFGFSSATGSSAVCACAAAPNTRYLLR